MGRRTKVQIEKDYNRIRKLLKNPNFRPTSINQIAKELGMSVVAVNGSLHQHPTVEKRILATIEANKNADTDSDIIGTQEPNVSATQAPIPTLSKNTVKYVIDASITGVPDFKYKILNLLEDGKIVLTTETLIELDKVEHMVGQKSFDARFLLKFAIKNPDFFEYVVIDKTNFRNTDDCIINYCCGKEDVTLITSDKVMCLIAKSYKINALFWEQPYQEASNNQLSTSYPLSSTAYNKSSKSIQANNPHYCTLQDYCPELSFDKPFEIDSLNSKKRKLIFIRDNDEYDSGLYRLSTQDHVLICIRKPGGCFALLDLELLNLEKEKNCRIHFKTLISSDRDLSKLRNSRYKNFAETCAYKLGFFNH